MERKANLSVNLKAQTQRLNVLQVHLLQMITTPVNSKKNLRCVLAVIKVINIHPDG